VSAQEALRVHAAAEKAYSEHKPHCWHESRHSPELCPKRLLRNIAYQRYTGQAHVSMR